LGGEVSKLRASGGCGGHGIIVNLYRLGSLLRRLSILRREAVGPAGRQPWTTKFRTKNEVSG
jgi:hypothetical protein